MSGQNAPKSHRDNFRKKKSITSSQADKFLQEHIQLMHELSFLPREQIEILTTCKTAHNVDISEYVLRFAALLAKYHGVSKRVITEWALKDFVAAELDRLGLLSPAAKEALQR